MSERESIEKLASAILSLKSGGKGDAAQPYKLAVFGFVLACVLPILGMTYHVGAKEQKLKAEIQQLRSDIKRIEEMSGWQMELMRSKIDSELQALRLEIKNKKN